MRLILTLEPEENEEVIGYDYMYDLHISFLKIFDDLTIKLRTKLLNYNLLNDYGAFEIYSISNLIFNESVETFTKGFFINNKINLVYSVPINDTLTRELFINFLENKQIVLNSINNNKLKLTITNIEIIKSNYKIKSSILVPVSSIAFEKGNYDLKLFFENDEELIKNLVTNRFFKFYRKIYQKDFDDIFEFNVLKKEDKNIYFKETSIKRNSMNLNNMLIFKSLFKIKSTKEMLDLIFSIGIGDFTKYGFGCVRDLNEPFQLYSKIYEKKKEDEISLEALRELKYFLENKEKMPISKN